MHRMLKSLAFGTVFLILFSSRFLSWHFLSLSASQRLASLLLRPLLLLILNGNYRCLLVLGYSPLVSVLRIGWETWEGFTSCVRPFDSRSNVLFVRLKWLLIFELGLVTTKSWLIGSNGGVVTCTLLKSLKPPLGERLFLSRLIFLFNRWKAPHHWCVWYVQWLLTLHLPILYSSTFLRQRTLLLFLESWFTGFYVPS